MKAIKRRLPGFTEDPPRGSNIAKPPKRRHAVTVQLVQRQPECIACPCKKTRNLTGYRGRALVALALTKYDPTNAAMVRAVECPECFKTFVVIDDPSMPPGRLS